jgi:hypothetical protein
MSWRCQLGENAVLVKAAKLRNHDFCPQLAICEYPFDKELIRAFCPNYKINPVFLQDVA